MVIRAWAYEIAAHLMLGPFGTLTKLRAAACDACALTAGTRVLEVGCGPGSLTRMLLDRGAQVHAVDASAEMLTVARRRAPGATYEHADATTFTPTGRYGAVVLSFILHELPATELPVIVRRVASALSSGARVVVVDHALPVGALENSWRLVLHAVETPAIDTWLAIDPATLLSSAGLRVLDDHRLANGRARLTVASPEDAR